MGPSSPSVGGGGLSVVVYKDDTSKKTHARGCHTHKKNNIGKNVVFVECLDFLSSDVLNLTQ